MPYARNLPSGPIGEGTGNGAPRFGPYSETITQPLTGKEYTFADEGSYLVAISPTAGTGIIGHAAPTTFDETKPYLFVYNGSGNLRLYPQFLRLHDTVVSVGGTRMQFTITTDVGNLYSSGGTAATVNPPNTEIVSPGANAVSIYQGAVVTAAATASRKNLGNYCLRGTIDVVEDNYTFVWGASDSFVSSSRVATVMDISQPLPPTVIGPKQCLKIHQWQSGQSTGPTFEMVFGFVLR